MVQITMCSDETANQKKYFSHQKCEVLELPYQHDSAGKTRIALKMELNKLNERELSGMNGIK